MTIAELQNIDLEKLQNEMMLKQIGKSLKSRNNHLIQKSAEIYFTNNILKELNKNAETKSYSKN